MTETEEAEGMGCDTHCSSAKAQVLNRAVTVNSDPAIVFAWICQLKAAPYSYDWIDNLGRQSPPHRDPMNEQLENGQIVMLGFRVIDFSQGQELTIQTRGLEWLLGQVVMSYQAKPISPTQCRLLGRLRVKYPAHPIGWLLRLILPLGDLIMMRKQLLTLKKYAEQEICSA